MAFTKRCFANVQSLKQRHPQVLRDLLCLFGNSKGWDMIERQAKEDCKNLPHVVAQFGYVDLAILAATHDWPKNKDILERANARARVHSKSAYVYYAPAMDKLAAYRETTEESLTEARELLREGVVYPRQAVAVQHDTPQIDPVLKLKRLFWPLKTSGKSATSDEGRGTPERPRGQA